ncbi:unnamed protein product [Caenorhabditis auriculariae]|uniref:Lon protease homolog n=1 Tax=Caenorhabditis auriculariae TaxID=2777116 RepID=A0A8S1GZ64_9PELO|nr:unnamed protein product [Caenorhabditis auriculariae]
MECRHCCRTFTTVKEVREHERVSHEEKVRRKQPQRWKCTYCHLEFLSRHGRDSHVVTHFSNVMDEVWKSLDDMQHEVSAMLNECPICSCVMGSRKSFRMHVIHRHLIIDPETFISKTNVKVEVKEEVEDPLYERNLEADATTLRRSLGPRDSLSLPFFTNCSMTLELPIVFVANGVVLPGASLKLPIRSKNNMGTVEKYLLDKSSKTIAVGYRLSQEKMFEAATQVAVQQVTCWTFNSHVQYTLHVVGLQRISVDRISTSTCVATPLRDVTDEKTATLGEEFLKIVKPFIEKSDNVEITVQLKRLAEEKNFGALVDLFVSQLKNVSYVQQLEFLASRDVNARLQLCSQWIEDQISSTRSVPSSGTSSLQKALALKDPQSWKKVSRSTGGHKSPVQAVEEKLKQMALPEGIQDKVMGEVERLKSMNATQSEHNVLLNWLELVAALPWNVSENTEIDLIKARTILEASHDAMDDVKQRVLEHLAVCKLNDSVNGVILCFSGPPGIGKTSVARAIAQSMGRKFQRVSLGGIRDESDIRGHRRTYVASMPGRIIEALKTCRVNNPVILLDEIDKLYAGNSGSPSAALLELLDPEQNNAFHDHYLNLPFDMSNVMFIATANDLSNVEPALRDRLEIIEMSGYGLKEKLNIARRHLRARQLLKHGICPDYLTLDDGAIETIIEEYTMEAGVRQLERHIASVCRYAALKLAEACNDDVQADVVPDLQLPIIVTPLHIHRILRGKQMNRIKVVESMRPLPPGVCFGLSVTADGGRVMPIEASKSDGNGKVTTTGKLGKVLEESVHVAAAWLASNAKRLEMTPLKNYDIHVHLPEGGIGKDGPSAGCGLAAALASLATETPLRSDTAITGEISLSGHVLPVGGIKEKVLAAQRERLQRVVLPAANRQQIEKLDDDVKREMELVLVENIDQVIAAMLENRLFSKL